MLNKIICLSVLFVSSYYSPFEIENLAFADKKNEKVYPLPEHLKSRPIDISSADDALMDLLVLVQDSDMETLQIAKGGYSMVGSAQLQSILSYFKPKYTISAEVGGSTSNTLRGAAMLGSRTSFSGVVGNDSYGKVFAKRLKELGIKAHLIKVPGVTGASATLVTPDHERTFNTNLGVSGLYRPEHLPLEDIRNSKAFMTSGYMFTTPERREALRQAFDTAREAKTWVVLDISDPFVVNGFKKEIWEEVDKGVDILFANRGESQALVGVSGRKAARQLSQRVGIAVVKNGEKGAFIGVRGHPTVFEIPATLVKALDTTGAGDMFAAGFLHSLLGGHDVKTAGKVGSVLAGDVVTRLGVTLNPENMIPRISVMLSKVCNRVNLFSE